MVPTIKCVPSVNAYKVRMLGQIGHNLLEEGTMLAWNSLLLYSHTYNTEMDVK